MRASAGRRILMLLENNPYPQDARVRREAVTLTDAGYDVAVIAPRSRGQRLSATVDGVKVYRYPAPPDRDGLIGYLIEYGYSLIAAALVTLYVAIRRGFDVIHAHNPPDTFALIAMWYKPLGKRFVFDHHDLSPEMYEARFGDSSRRSVRRVLQLLERLTFRVADYVIATNESYRSVAILRGGVPEDRVTVVRNGPDADRVKPASPDPTLGNGAGTVMAYVGVMGPQDGVDYLVRSLASLSNDLGRNDFVCFVVGSGSAVPGLKALTAELGMGDRIRFTGRISDEDLMRHLSTADICLAPDPYTPFTDQSTMIKITEYMALGKPTVAFDLTEHRRTAGDAALYAVPNDERDFASKLVELMDDPEKRERMGEIGRERIAGSLNWSHQGQRLIEAYAAILPLRG